jgi:thiamine monophosphate kinase
MKKVILVLLALGMVAAGVAFYLHARKPSTSAEALEQAQKTVARLEEKIRIEKAKSTPDEQAIDESDAKIDETWRTLIADWPDTPEADEAHYAIFKRELASTDDLREKIRLINEFLEMYPEHEDKLDLLREIAEMYRFEL